MSVFVTGTDTGVGKTYFSALLIRELRTAGIDAVGFKPVVCGSWDDVDALVEAADGCEPRAAVCPLQFDTPASPLTASRVEGRAIDPQVMIDAFKAIEARHQLVVVEGVGGWLVPITEHFGVAELAGKLGQPVIVVAQNRLGAINHTLLTIESLGRRNLTCLGIVLNHLVPADDVAMKTNRESLALSTSARILCEMWPGQSRLDLKPFGFALAR